MRAKGCLLASLLGFVIAFGALPLRAQETAQPAPPAVTQQVPQTDAPASAQPQGQATPSTASTAQAPVNGNAPTVPPQPSQTISTIPAMPHNLSPWGMFMAADIVVKAVMLGLAFASFVTWTVWLAKTIELATATAAARKVYHSLVEASSLYEATTTPKLRGFGRDLIRTSAHEVDQSEGLPADGIKERTVACLTRVEARAQRRMTRGMGVIATIGSTSPFVGLFGTVWGIMNSFIGIAESQTTNLAVVAPGIAEALLATAIGLVAAIPAVVIYNVFTRSISGYRALLADCSAEIMKHVSRDLDRMRKGRHLVAAE